MVQLTDATAVVTGGSSGIGRAIARSFAAEGTDVVVADVREEPREGGTPTHEVITEESDVAATFVDCDVSDPAATAEAMDAAEEFGGVDVLVNNAGIFHPEEFLETTEDEFDRMVGVNVKGVYFAAQAAAKRMVESGGGAIVNLSSVAGLEGTGAYTTYCTTKGAVRLMTYALADELGPEGIRVNAIHPGVIETSMTEEDAPIVGTETGEQYKETIPLRAFGEPEDIADAAVYLASDASDYVTGESLVVDGGMTTSG